MPVIDQKSDVKRFNETLKRMLKTPPQPHDKKRTVKDKLRTERSLDKQRKSDTD